MVVNQRIFIDCLQRLRSYRDSRRLIFRNGRLFKKKQEASAYIVARVENFSDATSDHDRCNQLREYLRESLGRLAKMNHYHSKSSGSGKLYKILHQLWLATGGCE